MGADTDEIVVAGYTPRYRAAVDALLGIEGGFVDDPVDRGGATKFGISLRFLAAEGAFDSDRDGKADFDLDFDGDIDGQDIRLLTPGDARFLYLKCFWKPIAAERLTRPIGEMVFDQAVNGGAFAAKKLLQRAINTCLMRIIRLSGARELLKIDGDIGPVTLRQMQVVLSWPSQGMPALMAAYRDAAKERYRGIVARYPEQKRFLGGWLARADGLGR